MTERVFTAEQLSGLPEHGAAAQKIRALYAAYGGGYDFCRFFRQGSTFLAALDGSFVLCCGSGTDWEELAGFLTMHGFTEIFCTEGGAGFLGKYLPVQSNEVFLMSRDGSGSGAELPECAPSAVWDIISSRFEIEFEPWYLDMSHRVRHGVTRCVSNGKAALVIQHELNGEALLSQVAVLPEHEHEGHARALINEVCHSLGGTVQVLCEKSLTEFYKKCGFELSAEKYAVLNRGNQLI